MKYCKNDWIEVEWKKPLTKAKNELFQKYLEAFDLISVGNKYYLKNNQRDWMLMFDFAIFLTETGQFDNLYKRVEVYIDKQPEDIMGGWLITRKLSSKSPKEMWYGKFFLNNKTKTQTEKYASDLKELLKKLEWEGGEIGTNKANETYVSFLTKFPTDKYTIWMSVQTIKEYLPDIYESIYAFEWEAIEEDLMRRITRDLKAKKQVELKKQTTLKLEEENIQPRVAHKKHD